MSSVKPTLRERTAAEIRAEMARQRRSGVELASHLHISQQAASRRLNAEVDVSLDELDKIAAWLGVPFAQLLGREAVDESQVPA